MPRSAMAEGVVDMVLSPQRIAEEIGRISTRKEFFERVFSEDEDGIDNISEEDFTAIIELLRKSTGADFKHYKTNTIKRRILRRMLLQKFETLKEYLRYLKQHASEITA
jgi:two-component system CheB/CheR fusion protein